jgi:dephospho-CoA kinase
MLRVGLTGGIGSGKSTVAGIFGVLGIPVSYADESARSIMNENEELKQQIIFHFGPEAYSPGGAGESPPGGHLNRSWLAAQVFSDPGKLELLNSLVHPATIRAGEQWMKEQSGKTPYAIKEAALIFESRSAQNLDYVIGVYAPADLRIERTMKRNNISHEEVIKRMNSQINEDLKMKLCDFVIRNDERQAVLPQVLELHEKLLGLAGKR